MARHGKPWDSGYGFRSGDFREAPGRDQEQETGDPCACGMRCAESDYQGNARCGPRPFCETDRAYIGDAIRALPVTYGQLRVLLARSQQQEERVSGSRDAPIPVAADVQAFMREIVHVAASWEDQVEAVARLAGYPDGPRRDEVILACAARTLAGVEKTRAEAFQATGHLDTLLSLPPEEKVRFVPPARLDEEPDLKVWFDTSGDAWETRAMDGTGAGLEFLALLGRARGMIGLTRRRRRITEVPCDQCGAPALIQREAVNGGWEPAVRCTTCPNAYTGSFFTHIMGRVYEAQVRALEAEEKRKRDLAGAAA